MAMPAACVTTSRIALCKISKIQRVTHLQAPDTCPPCLLTLTCIADASQIDLRFHSSPVMALQKSSEADLVSPIDAINLVAIYTKHVRVGFLHV
jgi:hypothetical protein